MIGEAKLNAVAARELPAGGDPYAVAPGHYAQPCSDRRHPCHSDKKHEVLRLRLLLGDHGATDGHDEGDDAVDALVALVLGRLEVAGGVLGDGDIGGHPVQRHCTERSPSPIRQTTTPAPARGGGSPSPPSCSSAPATANAPGSLMLFQAVSIQPSNRGTCAMRNSSIWPSNGSAMPITCRPMPRAAEFRSMGSVSLTWRRGSMAGRRGPRGCAPLAACRNLP
jgi:hypothetical protein